MNNLRLRWVNKDLRYMKSWSLERLVMFLCRRNHKVVKPQRRLTPFLARKIYCFLATKITPSFSLLNRVATFVQSYLSIGKAFYIDFGPTPALECLLHFLHGFKVIRCLVSTPATVYQHAPSKYQIFCPEVRWFHRGRHLELKVTPRKRQTHFLRCDF